MAFNVTDYGAVGNGTGDQSGAIQDAIDACAAAGGGDVYFPSGAYRITSGVLVSSLYTRLVGEGFASRLVFVPSADGSAVTFDRGDGSSVLSYCGVENLGFSSSTDDGHTKVALDVRDVSTFTARGVRIGPWTGDGASVGLKLRGRESISVIDFRCTADLPIRIAVNDRHTGGVSLDHTHFTDCYLLTTTTSEHPCVKIDDGVRLNNLSFGGFQAWAGGGLEWISTAITTGISYPISISNLRVEQIRKAGQHSIRIELPSSRRLRTLRLENCAFDLNHPAVRVQSVETVETSPVPIWDGVGSWLEDL